MTLVLGSPLYMAPEILRYREYTDLADLWSVGVILYELFFNRTPVKGKNIYNLVKNIDKFNFNVNDNKISKSLSNNKKIEIRGFGTFKIKNNIVDSLSVILRPKEIRRWLNDK